MTVAALNSTKREKMTLDAIHEPYTEELTEALCLEMQTNGYCILPDVWTRESVTEYERTIRTKVGPGAKYGASKSPVDWHVQWRHAPVSFCNRWVSKHL